MKNSFYRKWTWIPSEYVWVIGSTNFGMGIYKDFDEDKKWKYNIIINGEFVVMGEGKFESLGDCKIKATKHFIRLVNDFKQQI